MITSLKIILLLLFGIFVVFCVTCLRLLFEDCDAAEIELQEVETWDTENPSLKPD